MKILIDCGTHLGEGMTELIQKYHITDEWQIFTFEPNTDSYQQVIAKSFGKQNITFINKAIWITDGTVTFHAETPTASSHSDGAGSSIVDMSDWSPKNPSNTGVGDFDTSYEVPSVRLATFIKNHFSKKDFIVLKVDIEGAEFKVLNDLIATGAISYINDLYVEFHEWAMKSESWWSKYILKARIRMHNWNIRLTEWH